MFYILGLPRSRTAWLSSFLSDKDGLCIHEGSYHYPDYSDILESNKIVGDSTTALPLIKRYINPEDQVIVIERKMKDVSKSLISLFGRPFREEIELLKSELDTIENAIRIPYEEINLSLEEIWSVKGTPFNSDRAESFMNKHIENNLLEIMDTENNDKELV